MNFFFPVDLVYQKSDHLILPIHIKYFVSEYNQDYMEIFPNRAGQNLNDQKN